MITKKRIILTLTVVLMVFAMMPMAEGKAYASSGDPAMNLGTDVLDENVNTSTAQTVWYADKAWRVIGYDGKDGGAANKSGSKFCVACGSPIAIPDTAKKSAPAFAPIKEKEQAKEQVKEPVKEPVKQVQVSKYVEPNSVFAEGLPSWSLEPPQVLVRRH